MQLELELKRNFSVSLFAEVCFYKCLLPASMWPTTLELFFSSKIKFQIFSGYLSVIENIGAFSFSWLDIKNLYLHLHQYQNKCVEHLIFSSFFSGKLLKIWLRRHNCAFSSVSHRKIFLENRAIFLSIWSLLIWHIDSWLLFI